MTIKNNQRIRIKNTNHKFKSGNTSSKKLNNSNNNTNYTTIPDLFKCFLIFTTLNQDWSYFALNYKLVKLRKQTEK